MHIFETKYLLFARKKDTKVESLTALDCLIFPLRLLGSYTIKRFFSRYLSMKKMIVAFVMLAVAMVGNCQQNIEQMIATGMAYDSRGLQDSAIISFREALSVDSTNVEALWRIGASYLKMDSLRQAIDYEMIAIERDPKNKDAYYITGSAFYAQQRYKSAEEYLRRAVEFGGPGFVMAWCRLGEASLNLSDTAQAQECFEKVIENDAAFQRAYFNLGEIARARKQWAQAIEHYGLAIRKFPLYPEAHYNIALCYMEVGNLKKAIESLQKLAKMQPRNSEALFLLAKAYYQNSEQDKAVSQLKILLEMEPEYPQAQQMLNALGE